MKTIILALVLAVAVLASGQVKDSTTCTVQDLMNYIYWETGEEYPHIDTLAVKGDSALVVLWSDKHVGTECLVLHEGGRCDWHDIVPDTLVVLRKQPPQPKPTRIQIIQDWIDRHHQGRIKLSPKGEGWIIKEKP
jgi:hypothetical protein